MSVRFKISGVFFFCYFLFFALSAYPYSVPDFTKTFYGDANGDLQLQLNDVTVHNNFILFGDAPYNTLQPDTMTRKDDTCDVFPDGACQLSDITQMNNAILGSQLSIVWDSWEILDIDMPASASVGIETQFHLNVRGILGGTPWGRPGIVVKLTVAPDSAVSAASVFGRSCNPPASPDGNCALSVSVTDLPADEQNSTTESDANGFSFRADEAGTLTLVAEFADHILFNIPATSTRFDVQIGGNIRYVDIDATGAGTGTSWADAFNHTQDGVDAASSGDKVWVAEGTYYRPIGGTEPVLTMKNGVKIYGGFDGTENLLSERGHPEIHPTVLDGENTSFHVVWGASNIVLDGFTITGGNAAGSSYDVFGAGIINMDITDLTLSNCIIKDNTTDYGGGYLQQQCHQSHSG